MGISIQEAKRPVSKPAPLERDPPTRRTIQKKDNHLCRDQGRFAEKSLCEVNVPQAASNSRNAAQADFTLNILLKGDISDLEEIILPQRRG